MCCPSVLPCAVCCPVCCPAEVILWQSSDVAATPLVLDCHRSACRRSMCSRSCASTWRAPSSHPGGPGTCIQRMQRCLPRARFRVRIPCTRDGPSTPTRVDRLPPAVTTNQSTYGLTEVALGGETYVCALDARSPRVRSKVSDVWAPGKSVCWSYAGTAAA